MTLGAEQEARQAAERFRGRHHLGVQPIGDLVTLIEQTTGHDVAVLDADQDEHGLTMRDPVRKVVFIGVARSRNPMRQRSTLAHELGHLLFEDWNEDAAFGCRSPEEIRAGAFARHLLVPVEGVKEFLGHRGSVSESDLSSVVQRFLVSPQMASIAMRDAGYVDAVTFGEWMAIRTPRLATRYGWNDYYASLQDDSNRLRAPQALVARAVAGYAEGVVSVQAIATLRGVSVEVASADLAEAGIVAAVHEAADISDDDLPSVDIDLSDLEDEDDAS